MRVNDTGVRLGGAVAEAIREISRSDVEPLLDRMAADGLDVRADEGIWLGAVEDGGVVGVARLFRHGGHDVVDDVWTHPDARRRGVAARVLAEAARRSPVLWLICDEPDIAYYARQGFTPVEQGEFPAPLAEHYRRKDEWPAAPDHEHYAMVKIATPDARS